ncbi:MAG TPA: RNA polymerase sigma factor FliA [Spongiibacteraceae bacterium]|nr:RNA polymerase sigma factor FliA [Spongiibacteraceae bacterium]
MAATNNGWSMYSEAKSANLEDLVTRHGLLVKRIAHHLMARLPASVQVDDLLQAGMVGLLEAARNYDSSKGASFETYAGIRIRGAMIDDVRRGDWAPRSVHRNSRRVQEAIHRIERRQGHDPSDQQVAAELGISIDEYHAILQDSLGSRLFSLDELGWGDDDNEDRIPGPGEGPLDDLTHAAFRDSLAQAIAELPERERLVLALYYDEELNLKEIGLVLGVSESRVSQIHSQAAQRLRARLAAWSTSE